MKKFFKPEVLSIQPYRLASHDAWNVDEDVLKLDWNESTINVPDYLINEIVDLLESRTLKLNWYPDTNNAELRFLLADYVELPVEFVQYYSSSDSLHESLATALINKGDNVLAVAPTYDNFRVTMELNGAKYDYFRTCEDEFFQVDFLNLSKFIIKNEPKIVYMGFPNNPTGTQLAIEEIEYLISNSKNTLFVIDEAYYEFSTISVAKLIPRYNNLVVTRTFSKAFGIASLRIGYLIAQPEFHELMNRVRNAKSISSIAQIAAITLLKRKDSMKAFVKEINEAKIYLIDELTKLGNFFCLKSNANFVLIKVINDKQNLIHFLREQNIFVRDFNVDELKDYLRITIGTKVQMEKLVKTIKIWVEK